MKQKYWLFILIIAFNAFYTVTQSVMAQGALKGEAQELRSDNTTKVQHRAGEILFQISNPNKIDAEQVVTEIIQESVLSIQLTEVAKEMGIYKIKFDPQIFDEKALLNKFRWSKRVGAAQFNHIVQERAVPNDPLYPQQWSLPRIGANAIWDISTGGVTACGDTIVVAVLDRGFEVTHTDLKPNIWYNRAEIPNNKIDDDKNGYVDDYQGWNFELASDIHSPLLHGTNCAGVIGAKGNNSVGVTGVNWNVKLMILSGIVDDDKIIAAYNYAINQRKKYTQTNGKEGAFVVTSSMSLGFRGVFPSDFPLICNVYNTLSDAGILNVVAADNINNDIEKSGDIPGLCPNEHLLVINRTDKEGNLPLTAAYSAKFIDLSAPGENVYMTSLNNDYIPTGGNSFAAPLVAGSGALLIAASKDSICKLARRAPTQAMIILKDALIKGAEPLPALKGKTITGGQLNLQNSFRYLSSLFGAPVGDYEILKIYPSPVDKQLYIAPQLPEKVDAELMVMNTVGQLVFQRKLVDNDLFNNKILINTEKWVSGIYFVTILSNKYKSTKKIVVEHR